MTTLLEIIINLRYNNYYHYYFTIICNIIINNIIIISVSTTTTGMQNCDAIKNQEAPLFISFSLHRFLSDYHPSSRPSRLCLESIRIE